MEEKIVSLKVNDNIDKTIAATKSLKAQLREAVAEVQQLSEKYGESSEQAVQAAKRAAGLKDRIEDANDAVQAFKGEGAFLATSKAIGAAASGLAAVQGGLGLIGVEGENVEKTILKVQSAMALSQGLAGLEDAGRSFKQMGVVAAQALKGIRTGIAATGIGVLLVALGAVVAYWDDIKEAVSGVSDEQKNLNELGAKQLEQSKKELDNLNSQDNTLKLQGKTETEILEIKKLKTQETIKEGNQQIINLQKTAKLQAAAAARNQSYLQNFARFAVELAVWPLRVIAAPIDLLINTANKVAEILGFNKVVATDLNTEISRLAEQGTKAVATFVFDPKQIEADAQAAVKAVQDGNLKLQNSIDGYTLQQQASAKAAADKKAADEKAAAEKALAAAKKAQEDFLDNLTKDAEARKKANELILLEQDEASKALNAIADENIAKEKARAQSSIDIETFRLKTIGQNHKDAADAKKKIDEEEFAAKQKLNDATVAGLMVVSDLVGRETAKGKALAVAASLINTYSAIAGQLKAFAGVPIPGYAIVQAITTGLAGFAAVRNILKVQVPNGGGGGGSAPSMGGMVVGGGRPMTAEANAPQFNVVGAGGTNQLAQAMATNQAPIKAFVVSNDVTTAQSLDRNIVKSATLG
jgi:hypothetical protein